MAKKFWTEQNSWWRAATRRMAAKEAKPEDWDEANRRLWCLTYRRDATHRLGAHDKDDLIQTVLLRLQEQKLINRLAGLDAPAHYLVRLMENATRNERRRRTPRRAAIRFRDLFRQTQDQRPDHQAELNELCAKVRYVVNHVLRAEDRKVLWWFYRDESSVAEIAGRLKVTETAALQRLSRARRRLREEFGK